MPRRLFEPRNRNWLLIVAILLAITPGAITPYIATLTPEPLEYRNLPMPVLTPEVEPGQAPTIVITRCNHEWRPLPYSTNRRLQSIETGVMVQLDTSSNIFRLTSGPFEEGCEDVLSRGVLIPIGTEPGEYRITGISEAKGMWKTSYAWLETETFRVIASENDNGE